MTAHSYILLQQLPLVVTSQDRSYAGLSKVNADASNDILSFLQASTAPWQDTTFSPVILNSNTLPGFADMLANGSVTFMLTPCHSAWRGLSNVRVKKVSPARTGMQVVLVAIQSGTILL